MKYKIDYYVSHLRQNPFFYVIVRLILYRIMLKIDETNSMYYTPPLTILILVKTSMKKSSFFVFISLFTVSLPAMAYIDPGSGSAIMSAVIGFFVAIGMAVKTYWYKIKSLLTKKKPPEENKNKEKKQDPLP